MSSPDGIRLQKVLASAGVGSRRKCEELIAARRVAVDGALVAELGARVDPAHAVVTVDGKRINTRPELVYLVLNKPLGVLSAMADDRGRATVGDVISRYQAEGVSGLFHVGRLDADTEGLLLITNDGELGHRLMHPSYEVPKTYVATVAGRVGKEDQRRLRSGVSLDDGPIRVDASKLIQATDAASLVEVTLHEGRNRIVRRMFSAIGHPVQELVRTRIGEVRLANLRSGQVRPLNADELSSLFRLVSM